VVLFEDPDGLAKQACCTAGGEDGHRSVMRLLRKRLVRIAKVDPPPDQVQPSSELVKLLQAAAKAMKARGDTFLGVDLLIRHILDAVRAPRAVRAQPRAGRSADGSTLVQKDVDI